MQLSIDQQPSPSRIGSPGSGIEASPWEFTSPSRPKWGPRPAISHAAVQHARVRHRFASDAHCPALKSPREILTVSSHHYAIGRSLEMTEEGQGEAALLRHIRPRDHAYLPYVTPCVLRTCTGFSQPKKLGLFSAPWEAQGERNLATRPKSLIPVKTIPLPAAPLFFPFLDITPWTPPPGLFILMLVHHCSVRKG